MKKPKETFWPTQYVAEGESFRKDGLGPNVCLRHIHQRFIFWGMDQMPEPHIILSRPSFSLLKTCMCHIFIVYSVLGICACLIGSWKDNGFLKGEKLKIPGAEVFGYLIIRVWKLSGASRGTDRWSLGTLSQLLLGNIGRGTERTFSKAHAFIFQMEKEVPHAPLISSNQRRARSSFFFWTSCHSQINRIWEMLWEEAKCFQWSWLVPTLVHVKLNRGCSLQSELQSYPLTWMREGHWNCPWRVSPQGVKV